MGNVVFILVLNFGVFFVFVYFSFVGVSCFFLGYSFVWEEVLGWWSFCDYLGLVQFNKGVVGEFWSFG